MDAATPHQTDITLQGMLGFVQGARDGEDLSSTQCPELLLRDIGGDVRVAIERRKLVLKEARQG